MAVGGIFTSRAFVHQTMVPERPSPLLADGQLPVVRLQERRGVLGTASHLLRSRAGAQRRQPRDGADRSGMGGSGSTTDRGGDQRRRRSSSQHGEDCSGGGESARPRKRCPLSLTTVTRITIMTFITAITTMTVITHIATIVITITITISSYNNRV